MIGERWQSVMVHMEQHRAGEDQKDPPDDPMKFANAIEEYSNLHCKGGVIDREDCKWYHGSWKYLKYLGLVSCPEWHKSFYISNIVSHINSIERNVKILISGAADDGTFSVVTLALQSARHAGEIVVLDMCPTPVYASLLSAQGKNIKDIHGVQAIIPFTPFPNDYFDIIVTDAFLTRFLKEEKLEIVPEWKRILKTGGIVLTTARVENAKTETVIADKSSQNDYVLAAQEIGRAKGLDVDDIKNRAKTYAEKITSHPFNDLDEIKTLFTGFTVEAGIADNDFVEIVPRKYARIRAKKEGVAV
mgnify:FL=1